MSANQGISKLKKELVKPLLVDQRLLKRVETLCDGNAGGCPLLRNCGVNTDIDRPDDVLF